MSEKVTFHELIEAIAAETDNSQEFTHDFIKSFVEVVNDGLDADGDVNVAGFGKFKLRPMDEREGYNPQTDEKITIPAHNKVVFKPYKDLRELVNAPYAHLEPELIPEEPADENTAKEDEDSVKEEQDFIPTAPPTSFEHEPEAEGDEKETDNDEEEFHYEDLSSELEKHAAETSSTFSFVEDEEDTSDDEPENEEFDNQEDDIVEYSEGPQAEEEQKEDLEPDDFMSIFDEEADTGESDEVLPDEDESRKQEDLEEASEISNEEIPPFYIEREENEDEPEEETEENEEEYTEPEESTDEPFAFSEEEEDEEPQEYTLTEAGDANDKAEHKQHVPSLEDYQNNEIEEEKDENHSVLLFMLAAVILLLLLAGGAWYWGLFSGSNNYTKNDSAVTRQKTTGNTASSSSLSSQSTQAKNSTKNSAANANKSQKPSKQASRELTIAKGQTLWGIAKNQYQNAKLWPWIYDHNDYISNPDVIIAGSKLTIPLPSGTSNGLTASDSVAVAKAYIATYKWYKDRNDQNAKNYLWVAKTYHGDIREIADIPLDKADLAFANRAH